MIDCSSEYIWYKKGKRIKKPKRLFAFFLFLIIIIGIVIYGKLVVAKRIFSICNNFAHTYSAAAINDAVIEKLSSDVQYNDLISIEKNNSGDVVMMSANSYKVNLLSREIVEETSLKLKKDLTNGAPIPMLAFTGIGGLSGYGAPINYKAIYVSSVECSFDSEFKAVGVNQTLHSIYVEVICTVNVKAFLDEKNTVCASKVLIGETVLIGKVPDTYLNGKLFG